MVSGLPAGSPFGSDASRFTNDASRAQLSADQLALLNNATITIADLADGYLALTTGTTITLDTDAAGYGWFIDSTPLRNEEFAANATSPWQFTALEGSAAAGKIDLMTVLMHELGHVMSVKVGSDMSIDLCERGEECGAGTLRLIHTCCHNDLCRS